MSLRRIGGLADEFLRIPVLCLEAIEVGFFLGHSFEATEALCWFEDSCPFPVGLNRHPKDSHRLRSRLDWRVGCLAQDLPVRAESRLSLGSIWGADSREQASNLAKGWTFAQRPKPQANIL